MAQNEHFAGAKAPLIANVICMASMIAWAAGFPSADILLRNWDPMALIVVRLAIAVGVLLPIWLLVDGASAIVNARWGRGLIIGGIGFGAGTYLILMGQKMSDPVTVTIIAATMPVVGGVLEVLFDGRRLRPTFVAGIAIALVGACVAALLGAEGEIGQFGLGAGLALVSVVLFGWASRAAVVDLPDLSGLGQTTLTFAGALIFTTLMFVTVWVVAPFDATLAPVDGAQVMHLAIYAIGAMALSQILWLTGVKGLGVATASLHMNATPFYVMLIVVAAGGGWNGAQAIGGAIVALGILVAQWRPSRLGV